MLSYALGAVGGFAAKALHLPLPMLLGSLLAVGTASVTGMKLAGHLPQVPQKLRQYFIPIIGVAIGGAFSPDILSEAKLWWPSLLALCLFIPAVHFVGYRALRATGRVDPITAYFGTAPGGLIEAVQMGEEMGADPRMLTMLQFLRLILTIILVPLAFTWITGHAVGSAGGTTMGATTVPLTIQDALILAAAAIVGAWLGMKSNLPAGMITGPIILSGAAHLAGLTATVPPGWLIALTQVVIGTSLGVRFAGTPASHFVTGVRLAVLNVALTIGAATAVAFLLARHVHEPPAAVFLAFAPGGLAEMALIALSLQMSVLYVTAHHIARIILAVTVARLFANRIRR